MQCFFLGCVWALHVVAAASRSAGLQLPTHLQGTAMDLDGLAIETPAEIVIWLTCLGVSDLGQI